MRFRGQTVDPSSLDGSAGKPPRFRLTASRAMVLFGILFVAGFAAVVAVSNFALKKLEIGGPAFRQIMVGQALINDIQPPPIFTVEAYILAGQMKDGVESAATGKKRMAELKLAYLKRKAFWDKADITAAMRTELNMVIIGNTYFWTEIETVFIPALEKGDKQAALSSYEKLGKTFNIHANKITKLVDKAETYLAGVQAEADAEKARYETIMLGTAGIVLVMVALMLVSLYRHVIKAISTMAAYMNRLATDDYEAEVPYTARRDEIGEMAKAVSVFRAAGLEKRRLESQAESTRQAIDGERSAREAETRTSQEASELAVATIGGGLKRLADGDLVQRLTTPLSHGADQLRADFNASVEKLQDTLLGIHASAVAIRGGLRDIASASDDLSRRSEQQAASLEETASALDHITETVRKTADGAVHARKIVADTKANAEQSRVVVRQAIGAMGEIERSSREITNIIGVIDEIAFQTNLLALNAGVEAARAGEAGRGFAVVASEVRSLAQRSAGAAKEIKALIGTSSNQVSAGVRLVADTGGALEKIVDQVNDINVVVVEIAVSAAEQATGLREVNIAVGQMDQATQQNAAMVEETNAASHTLSRESGELVRLVGQFQVGKDAAHEEAAPTRYAANRQTRAPRPASLQETRVSLSTRSGGVALRVSEPKDDVGEWEDF